jgi:hypothetical protein
MYISKEYLVQKWKVLLGNIIYVFLFRSINVSCFYVPTFIFKIKFWIYKVHVGNTYFFLRMINFHHWKNKDKYLTIKQQSRVRIPQSKLAAKAGSTSKQPKLAAQVSSQSWQHKLAALAGLLCVNKICKFIILPYK